MAEQLDRIELPQAAEVNFDAITADRLREMAAAAAGVVEYLRVLANSGGNIVGEFLRDVETFSSGITILRGTSTIPKRILSFIIMPIHRNCAATSMGIFIHFCGRLVCQRA